MPRSLLVVMIFAATVLAATTFASTSQQANQVQQHPRPAVAELFEDDADGLIRTFNLPSPGYSGEARAETNDVFSGRRSIKILPIQRQYPTIPGWAFRIALNDPGRGSFVICGSRGKPTGVPESWFSFTTTSITTSAIPPGWTDLTGARSLSPPARLRTWVVVTCDLFRRLRPAHDPGHVSDGDRWPRRLLRPHLSRPDH